MIDGVVRAGDRTVATSVQRFKLKIHIDLFAGLNSGEQTLVFILLKFAAVQVDAVFRVYPVAMFPEQPVHAVEGAALLVGGQRENEVAIRQISFFFQADEIGDQDGVAFLHIFRAAAVEVAVFLDEFEGIGGPVRPERFDDVQVPDKQDGLAFSGSAKTRDEILLAPIGPGYMNVVFGKASVEQTPGHRFGSSGDVANGVGGVDLNELLENFARELLGLILTLSSSRGRTNCD